MWYDKDGNGTNDYPRGIWKYDQWMTLLGAWMGTGLEAATGKEWYQQTHGVPHMVRVLQDGTGRLLVTSSDRDQSTHLWLIKDPAHMTAWTEVINSSDIKSAAWTNQINTNGPGMKVLSVMPLFPVAEHGMTGLAAIPSTANWIKSNAPVSVPPSVTSAIWIPNFTIPVTYRLSGDPSPTPGIPTGSTTRNAT